MKKKYLLLIGCFLLSFSFFAQELLVNGDFESWDDVNTPTGWTKVEDATQDSSVVQNGTYSLMHTGGTSDIAQTITGIVPGNSYTISIWYKVDPNSGDGDDVRIWSYWKDDTGSNVTDASTDGALRGPDNGYFDNNGGEWTNYTATVVAPAGVSQFYFELRTYSGAIAYYDNLSFFQEDTVAQPTLTIDYPLDGAVYSSVGYASLTINNFLVMDAGEDDGYIQYSIDEEGTNTVYTSEFDFVSLEEGEHTLKVWLVDPQGEPLDPAVEATSTFTVSAFTQVLTIAELRQGTIGQNYELTGEAILTYIRDYRGQKYMQDNTAGILIDDNSGVITTAYNTYDGVSGIKGALSEYGGVLQFIPTEDPGMASSTGNIITAEVISLDDLVNNPDDYESELVTIEGLSFTDADGVATFGTSTNYTITDGTTSSIFRTSFFEADYIGDIVPTGTATITALAGEYNGTAQIYATQASDIVVEANNDPQIIINSPSEEEIFPPSTQEIDVTFTLLNADWFSPGVDGYVKYTLYSNNDSVDSALIESATGFGIQVRPGVYTLEVELVNINQESYSPAITDTVNFTVSSENSVANLTELRSGTQGEFYQVTGEVILTYDTENTRNQKYIMDSSGAGVLIDDSNGVITTSYSIADGITGLTGYLSSYNGVLQFVPSEDPGVATSSDNPIAYTEVTSLAELTTNPDLYESLPVVVNNVTFTDADGTNTFGTSTNYTISKDEEETIFRTQFSDLDFIESVIPTEPTTVTGIASEYGGAGQIYAISVEDVATASVKENSIEGFATYPNPVNNSTFTLTSASANSKSVSLFNVLGKTVLKTIVSGTKATVDVSSLQSGMYILKVEEDNSVSNKTLIIK